VAEQDDTVRDLAALVVAALACDRSTYAYADRITSRLGLGEDDDVAATEAELRKALGLAPGAG
jgi:hypothetical protein